MSQAPNSAPAIEIVHLRKAFGRFVAIDDLSLTVHHGEIFGLLGPNGSGKTTTINMISGLTKATSGTIKVLGRDINQELRTIRASLGTVPQETALYEELSAWRNMSFHADLYGVPLAERDARITELLQLVELLDRKNDRVGTFSGGMKRRIALARALLHQPELIYLDEPTLGVDVQSRHALWDYILALKGQGKTVLITTNYLEEANTLCDRLAIIDRGHLVAVDTPDNLKQRFGGTVLEMATDAPLAASVIAQIQGLPGVSHIEQDGTNVRVSLAGAQPPTAEVVNLVSAASSLSHISQREPSLDEIFLLLTGKPLRD